MSSSFPFLINSPFEAKVKESKSVSHRKRCLYHLQILSKFGSENKLEFEVLNRGENGGNSNEKEICFICREPRMINNEEMNGFYIYNKCHAQCGMIKHIIHSNCLSRIDEIEGKLFLCVKNTISLKNIKACDIVSIEERLKFSKSNKETIINISQNDKLDNIKTKMFNNCLIPDGVIWLNSNDDITMTLWLSNLYCISIRFKINCGSFEGPIKGNCTKDNVRLTFYFINETKMVPLGLKFIEFYLGSNNNSENEISHGMNNLSLQGNKSSTRIASEDIKSLNDSDVEMKDIKKSNNKNTSSKNKTNSLKNKNKCLNNKNTSSKNKTNSLKNKNKWSNNKSSGSDVEMKDKSSNNSKSSNNLKVPSKENRYLLPEIISKSDYCKLVTNRNNNLRTDNNLRKDNSLKLKRDNSLKLKRDNSLKLRTDYSLKLSSQLVYASSTDYYPLLSSSQAQNCMYCGACHMLRLPNMTNSQWRSHLSSPHVLVCPNSSYD